MGILTTIRECSLPALLSAACLAGAADKVLLFTRTVVVPGSGYREDNILPARTALKLYLEKKGLEVDTSESDTRFTDATLATYKTIIFLKTSGNILNTAQHDAFERYFRAGGGFIGIHSALDTEFNWAFYGQIIGGAWYKSLDGSDTTHHTIVVQDSTDISTRFLPRRWARIDEIYGTKANPRSVATVTVLATVDESSFKRNGSAATDHPMTWKNELLGGRAWITAMGHTTASYSDTLFLNHLWGGIQYALGRTTTSITPHSRREADRGEGEDRTFLRLRSLPYAPYPPDAPAPLIRDFLGRGRGAAGIPAIILIRAPEPS